MDVTCPQCMQSDQVKKISEWVEQDSSNNVARQFIPRSQPEAPSPFPGLNTGLGCLGIIFFGAVFFFSVQVGSTVAIIIFGVFFALFVVAFTAAYLRGRRARQAYIQAMITWQDEIERWKQLYYCNRDDIVFNPESKLTSSAQDWQTLIEEGHPTAP
jgi:hypothetical protein